MKKFLVVFILVLFSGLEAHANPYWVAALRATPAAGPHVKLVYLVASANITPVVQCLGTSCSPWTPDGETSENTGSGSKNLHTMHMCDCHVPIETLLEYKSDTKQGYYAATSVTVSALYQRDPIPASPCMLECELADKQDAGATAQADAIPVATGGSSGTGGASATGGSSGTEGTSSSGDGAGTGGVGEGAAGSGGISGSTTTPTAPDVSRKQSEGACTFAPTAQDTALPTLVVLAGVALLWRRRSRPR